MILTIATASVVYLTGCTHGSIRLRGGSTSMNGRVEVCLNGDWGTVCDDGWSTIDGNIACRQLGFSNSSRTFYDLSVNINVHIQIFTRCTSHYHDVTMFTFRFHTL